MCGFADTNIKKIYLPIVPVLLRGGFRSTVTHALLDPGASTSLMSEQLANTLKLKGNEESMELETVCGKTQKITWLVNLQVQSLDDSTLYSLNNVRTLPNLTIAPNCIPTKDELCQWPHLNDIVLPDVSVADINFIIGQDSPELLKPLELRLGKANDPYATRTALGWAFKGPIDYNGLRSGAKAYFLSSDAALEKQVQQFWKLDDPLCSESMSVNEKTVIEFWENSVEKVDSHFSLKIPFKDDNPNLPANLSLASHSLNLLGKRLSRDVTLKEKYVKQMDQVFLKGYAERVPGTLLDRDDGRVWYIPHHPVVHPRKPGKVRVVYDCAAKFKKVSLNDVVHQGPDLTNKLISVLLKFRQGHVPLLADIEGMYYQVKVDPDDRDALRFLWWKDGRPGDEVIIYRMTSHLFGGVWSPSVANFALKKCASDNKSDFDDNVISTIKNNFYVDDCLKSVDNVIEAVSLAKGLREILALGGFNLVKFVSNSKDALHSLPECARAQSSTTLELNTQCHTGRALGTLWDIDKDCLGFNVTLKDKPHTKRGMLSLVSSVYDPLGLACPFVAKAKMLFQLLCREKRGWDDKIPHNLLKQWLNWLSDVNKLKGLSVARCLKPLGGASLKSMQLHHFSDAFEHAFGAVTYLRTSDINDEIYVCIVMAKSRLAPLKAMTIPRLELSAAVVSIKVDQIVREHLELELEPSVFWTDSTIVLNYLKNEDKRFKTFVSNRISLVCQHSSIAQWKYVPSAENSAADVSRGMTADSLLISETWVHGPKFLKCNKSLWPNQPDLERLTDTSETKKVSNVYQVQEKNNSIMEKLMCRFSSWTALRRAVAYLLRAKDCLRKI